MKRTQIMLCAVALALSGWAVAAGMSMVKPAKARALVPVSPASGSQAKLTLEVAAIVINVASDQQTSRDVVVTYQGSGGYLDVMPGAPVLAPEPSITPLGNGRYSLTLTTSARLAAGVYRGNLRLRMCQESPCVTPIVGAVASIPYRVMVSWVNPGEWQTFQRDSAHTGYVPVLLAPSRFLKKWEWKRSTSAFKQIHPVVTEAGKVLVSDDDWYDDDASLRALNEADGSELWRQRFPGAARVNPPATSNGKTYLATTGTDIWNGESRNFLWSFRSDDGAPAFQAAIDSQFGTLFAPTVRNGVAYLNAGYHGGEVYAFDDRDGMLLWSRVSGQYTMTTPAVDDSQAYFYSGTALDAYDAVTGENAVSISDPDGEEAAWYNAAPMLGSGDNIFSFSGASFNNGRKLVNYSFADQTIRWRTAKAYVTQPAVANGVVYAASNNPKSLDAIDEATGEVLWSWVPATSDTLFRWNVVVTKNLVFVSTNRAVYAIDLETHLPVWSQPTPGILAISGSGTLYIVEGFISNENPTLTGRLIAFNVR